jgi:hypothetical protein
MEVGRESRGIKARKEGCVLLQVVTVPLTRGASGVEGVTGEGSLSAGGLEVVSRG